MFYDALKAVDTFGSISAAARELGLSRQTLQYRVHAAKARNLNIDNPQRGFKVDPLPSKSIPVEKRIEMMEDAFKRRHEYELAKKWRPIKIEMDGPIGIQWFGDPHIDDNGCNWPLLKRDVDIVKKTEGMFGANIGDTTNNWIGRLARLYANQDTSEETALELAHWFMEQIPWLLIIRGNHDLWSGTLGKKLFDWMAQGSGPVADWQAQIALKFPNGREAKIWAAHSFPGTSMWNPLHASVKRAQFTGEAHLYISGHHHDWALYETEDPHRGNVYWAAKARGYKFIDSYASNLGYGAQQHGASITAIFDPEAEGPAFLKCFSDCEEAAEYLTWKRKKRLSGRR
jgi:hypothetical protein